MKHPPPKALIGFLKPYDEPLRKLALATRALVLSEMAPCHENIYDAYSAVALGYGPTDRLRDCICHIAVYTKHVNVGFNRGSELPNEAGVLQGTGRRVRHITVRAPDDLAKPEIRRYLRLARRLAGKHPDAPRKVISTVKAIYARKRRPR